MSDGSGQWRLVGWGARKLLFRSARQSREWAPQPQVVAVLRRPEQDDETGYDRWIWPKLADCTATGNLWAPGRAPNFTPIDLDVDAWDSLQSAVDRVPGTGGVAVARGSTVAWRCDDVVARRPLRGARVALEFKPYDPRPAVGVDLADIHAAVPRSRSFSEKDLTYWAQCGTPPDIASNRVFSGEPDLVRRLFRGEREWHSTPLRRRLTVDGCVVATGTGSWAHEIAGLDRVWQGVVEGLVYGAMEALAQVRLTIDTLPHESPQQFAARFVGLPEGWFRPGLGPVDGANPAGSRATMLLALAGHLDLSIIAHVDVGLTPWQVGWSLIDVESASPWWAATRVVKRRRRVARIRELLRLPPRVG